MHIPAIDIDVVAGPAASRAAVRRREPVRIGLPLARCGCTDPQRLQLRAADGRPQPVQVKVLDRWSDGSVRWLLVDFLADYAGSPSRYQLVLDAHRDGPSMPVLTASESQGEISIDSGAARFRLRPRGSFPFEEVRVRGLSAIDPARSGFRVQMGDGRGTTLVVDHVALEDAGCVRTVVRLEGWFRSGASENLIRALARLHFVAGSATVRFEVTLRNPRRAEHPGGFWELGDPGSLYVRDASIVVALPETAGASDIRCSPEPGSPLVRSEGALELFQASSGGEQWNSPNHLNRHRQMPLAFRGYRLRAGTEERMGLRATPIVSLSRRSNELVAAIPQFWQAFPKAVEADHSSVTLRLFPGQHGDEHELQGGEQKTHVFFVAFDGDHVSEVPLDWTRSPLMPRARPERSCSSRAVSYLAPTTDDEPAYAALVGAALDGPDGFEQKRERIDEYGWRNFGDLYADHEAAFHVGPEPLISHYNNQYDAIAGFAFQFMRSGDARWWPFMSDLAAHVRDIDIYHTDQDKAAYNGALFWHTSHYVDVGLSTHRSYPRAPRVGGGGPANEHNYSRGLLLHYFLTGEPLSREAVVDLARWVVDMDDGRKTVFRWLDRGATGLASQTASTDYHGPGRGCGNSIKVLLDGFTVTGDRVFLDKAEALIRRSIHPDDDIASRNLTDPESRWSYTVFLHALGTYLDAKAEKGETDSAPSDYARRSLIAYATWMADHEEPYLDRPEKLEYPTETWVAQELWKSEVFAFAAKHTAGPARARFLERSAYFFSYSITTLAGMKTRTLTRPLVLLLSHGFMPQFVSRHATSLEAPPSAVHPPTGPLVFVAQKARAKNRFVVGAGAAGLSGIALLAWFWLRVL